MNTQMKAAMVRRYGGPEVIALEQVPRPPVRAGEVLVRVRASPVTAADVRLRSAEVPAGYGPLIRLVSGLFGPRKPIPGVSFAGTVAEVGAGVTTFAVGERVFGVTGFGGGGHAEFVAMRADAAILPLPEDLTFEEGAAFCFGGLTASDFLIDKADLRPGEALLVLGATARSGAPRCRSAGTSACASPPSRRRRTSSSRANSAPRTSSTTRRNRCAARTTASST